MTSNPSPNPSPTSAEPTLDANNEALSHTSTPQLLAYGVVSLLAGAGASYAISGSIMWGVAIGALMFGSAYLLPTLRRLAGKDDGPRSRQRDLDPEGWFAWFNPVVLLMTKQGRQRFAVSVGLAGVCLGANALINWLSASA